MSVTSNMSDVSVLIDGEEVEIEKAIDDVIQGKTGLQSKLNEIHMRLRSLCTNYERGDFMESHRLSDIIDDEVSEMLLLFKDLKSITKELRLKADNDDEKRELIDYKNMRKTEKDMEKLKLKEQKEQKE